MFQSRYRYLYIVALGVYSYLNIKFTQGDQLFTVPLPEIVFFLAILLLVFFVWEGNRFLFSVIHRRINSRHVYKPLVVGFALSLAGASLLAVAAVGMQTLLGYPFTTIAFKLSLGFVTRVNLFLHCVNAIVFYHNKLRETQVQAERIKKEAALAGFDALRRQINPHFLFNSLNVLDGLVRTDTAQASKFIEQLSHVYRHLTKHETRELVRLGDELEFIEAYKYLLEIRFQNHLHIHLDVSLESAQLYVVPSAVQLLLENAVKHNEVSANKPLQVTVIATREWITVSNRIQPKHRSGSDSGSGLQNIRLRYEFLGQRRPEIINDGVMFTASLPLINLTEYEGSHN